MRILVVEDEPKVASFIRRALEEESYAVDVCGDGLGGLDWAQTVNYDLIILDLMLPGLPGVEVLKRARAAGVKTPVLILTARSEVDQRVKGLDAGADDYLTKPFAIEELLARARALLRRAGGAPTGVLQVEDLVLNPVTREVTRNGQRLDMTTKEYALLAAASSSDASTCSRRARDMTKYSDTANKERIKASARPYHNVNRTRIEAFFMRRSSSCIRSLEPSESDSGPDLYQFYSANN